LVFAGEKRPAAVAAVGTKSKATEVMKKLAEMWNALNNDQKKPYQGSTLGHSPTSLVDNKNFDHKLKVWSKIDILIKKVTK